MEPDAATLTSLRRGALEYCVLALLHEGERYGLDIARRLSAGGGVLLQSEGTLYPLLSRLRRDGTVATDWRESPSGPPRRYYRLTDTGRTKLSSLTMTWSAFRDAVDAVVGAAGVARSAAAEPPTSGPPPAASTATAQKGDRS